MNASIESVLSTLTRPVLVETVYQVLRAVTYREGAETMIEGMAREAPADEAAKAALDIIGSIEKEEGRSIKDLNGDRAEQYVRDFSAIVERRLRDELKYDESEADAKLRELRSSPTTAI